MTAVKAADVDSFLARPDPARPVVLIFGPDAGLVSERATALIKASVDDVNDPFSLVRLEAEELSANPARLAEEAQTIPLFGGRRAVWAKAPGLVVIDDRHQQTIGHQPFLMLSAATFTVCTRAAL